MDDILLRRGDPMRKPLPAIASAPRPASMLDKCVRCGRVLPWANFRADLPLVEFLNLLIGRNAEGPFCGACAASGRTGEA
jgi:hypothetical protein